MINSKLQAPNFKQAPSTKPCLPVGKFQTGLNFGLGFLGLFENCYLEIGVSRTGPTSPKYSLWLTHANLLALLSSLFYSDYGMLRRLKGEV